MKKATIVVSEVYQNNKLFDLNNTNINRDNCMHPFYILKEIFLENGIDLATEDINPIHISSIVIYNEIPKTLPSKKDIEKSFLLLFESELIRPDNWDLNQHQYFSKIFTWNDDFVDNKKYFKFNFAQKISKIVHQDINIEQKLCTLISGNKKNTHPLELYSKRIEAINWFEKKHSEDFEFYGVGWNQYTSANKYINYIVRKLNMSELLSSNYLSYKGKVDSKLITLQKYKFVICYENARDIPGYITEKIFDCLFAGCIPIYWGANNIHEYVPRECFIDKREFNSYEALYDFLKTMNNFTYNKYLKAIQRYLEGEQVQVFSSEKFASNIISEILKYNDK